MDRIYDCEPGLSELNLQRTFERCYILSPRGKEICRADGTLDEVIIPMRADYYGVTFTHNHTNNSPLSLTDVHLGCYHYMGEVRAVGDDRIYSLRNNEGTLSFELWQKLQPHVRCFIEAHGADVTSGDYDSFWNSIAVKYNLNYRIIPLDNYGQT